jgi:hypothetical protein
MCAHGVCMVTWHVRGHMACARMACAHMACARIAYARMACARIAYAHVACSDALLTRHEHGRVARAHKSRARTTYAHTRYVCVQRNPGPNPDKDIILAGHFHDVLYLSFVVCYLSLITQCLFIWNPDKYIILAGLCL